MGYKDVELGIRNYLQKRKTKYVGRCTFKERRRNKRFTMCYFHSTIRLRGIRKDQMESRLEGMQNHSTSTIGPKCIR